MTTLVLLYHSKVIVAMKSFKDILVVYPKKEKWNP